MIPLKRGNVFVASWASRFHILLRGRVPDRYQRGVNKAIDCALRNSVLRDDESRARNTIERACAARRASRVKRITRSRRVEGEERLAKALLLRLPRLPIIFIPPSFLASVVSFNNWMDFLIRMLDSFTRSVENKIIILCIK